MKLSEYLTSKLRILSPDDSVEAAGQQMRRHGASSMPVASERKLLGMLEQPDPDVEASRYGHDPQRVTVGEAMKGDAVCCREDDDCVTALELMNASEMDLLPVVDAESRIVGVVHREELETLAGDRG